MFYFLRKIVLLIFLALLMGFGLFLYQKRFVLNPVADFIEAWNIRKESPPRSIESLTGEVTKITGEYSLQLKSDQGLMFGFQLTGFEPISSRETESEKAAKLKSECQILLRRLVLSNRVRVDVTFLNEKRNGLGIVYLGQTNVNAALLEAGLGRINRSYLKGLSHGELYELLRAESKAKEQKRGVWAQFPSQK